jgi:hypothetical protein
VLQSRGESEPANTSTNDQDLRPVRHDSTLTRFEEVSVELDAVSSSIANTVGAVWSSSTRSVDLT